MRFVEFLENQFQTVTISKELAPPDKFQLAKDSEIQAVHMVLTWTRKVVKWAYVPKVFVHYAFVAIGLATKPEPVLFNRIKAQQAERQNELEKKAKKVGMLEMVQKEQNDAPTPA